MLPVMRFSFLSYRFYNRDGIEPVNFRSGDTSLKDKVKDVKGYNTEMSRLYKKGALFFLLIGTLFAVFPVIGAILLIFGCPVGIYLAYRVYKGILERYS